MDSCVSVRRTKIVLKDNKDHEWGRLLDHNVEENTIGTVNWVSKDEVVQASNKMKT